MFPLALNESRQLTRREWNPVEDFRRNFDSLFNQFFHDWGSPSGMDSDTFRTLDFDVDRSDDEFVVRAALPGFAPEDLDIQVDGNMLTVKAQKKQEDKNGRQYRSYYRSVSLPPGVDAERVQARCRNGMLELHLPRNEAAKPRKIAVQGDSKETSDVGNGHKKIAAETSRK